MELASAALALSEIEDLPQEVLRGVSELHVLKRGDFRFSRRTGTATKPIMMPKVHVVLLSHMVVVAAITRDTDQVPILVLRHPGNLLTVYANVGEIAVEKGDTIKRGQQVAAVAPGDPSFLHFEIREGIESVDPVPYLN